MRGAEDLYRQALFARRESLGDRHPDTITSVNNLGLLLLRKGKLREAGKLLVEAFGNASDVHVEFMEPSSS